MWIKAALFASMLSLAPIATATDERALSAAVTCGDFERVDDLAGPFGSPELVQRLNRMIPVDVGLGVGLTFDPPMYCFDPARPVKPEVMEAINRAVFQRLVAGYDPGSRWPGAEGIPITLTWSLVPDGTIVPSTPGNTAPSNLFAAMDAKFSGPGQGGRAGWINQIQACFNRWAAITGTTYTRVRFAGAEWDDGAGFPQANAQAGVRGDIRIGGCNVDGPAGGVLAFAFLPGFGGDMVLDTSENFGDSTNNYRMFRNTVMHEHGHTLGMPHMCSVSSNQLMEPFLDLTIDGPQHDDIRAGQRMYGDAFEPNDTLQTATDLEIVPIGQTVNPSQIPNAPQDNTLTSISVTGDVDLFKFTISTPTRIQIDAIPAGFGYDDNTQNLSNGTCNTGHVTDSRTQADLVITVVDGAGAVIYSQNNAPIGAIESSQGQVNLGTNGVYYVGVSAAGLVPQTQNYVLRISATTGCTTPTASPASQTVCQGGTASFTVAGSGSSPVRWRRNGVDIPNSNQTTLTLNSVTPANQGTYECAVDTNCGRLVTNAVTLSVTAGVPTMTSQPVSQTVCSGTIMTVSVAATGATGYQWRSSGSNIGGATGPSFTTSNAGNYDCVVSNVCGSATSSVAVLTTLPTLRVTQFPSPRTVCAGQSASFFYGVTGTALTYQWLLNNNPIPGATSSTYTIPSATAANAGTYLCSVDSQCGNSLSLPATLTVNAAPVVTTQPSPQTVCSGQSVSFTIAATGTPAPSFQWRRNGGNISGATSPTYSTIASAANAGAYSCLISNSCGSATTASADLTVNTTPSISANPASRSVCPGSPTSFSIVATGGALTYQWKRGGMSIPGATASTYAIAAVGPAELGDYTCVITNPCGSVTSTAAALTLNSPVSISGDPSPQTVCANSPAIFSVISGGTGPLTYQWRRNSANIPGATSQTYSIAAVSAADVGGYECVVTNACGSATSGSAALIMNVGPGITSQPSNAAVHVGDPVSFSVVAVGTAPLSYQWRQGMVAISGEVGATYSIASATIGDAGGYDCVVTNSCGSATSDVATLVVNFCVADTDDGSGTGTPDGGVTIDDLLYYLFIFETGFLSADVDDGSGTGTPDGGVTIDDLLYYLQRFEAGC